MRMKILTDTELERPTHRKSAVVVVCGGVFIACVLVGLFVNSAWPALVAFPCWILAYFIDRENKRSYSLELGRYRDSNARNHPAIFDETPPQLNSITGRHVDIYDLLTLTRLGRVERSDISAILRTYDDTPNLMPKGQNDIPFSYDDLEYFRDCFPDALSDTFLAAVAPILESDSQAELVLRWVESKDDGQPVTL